MSAIRIKHIQDNEQKLKKSAQNFWSFMNEYLEQTLLNAINSQLIGEKPEDNDHQRIVDEDDQVWYMEGYVNGIHSRWTINKNGSM